MRTRYESCDVCPLDSFTTDIQARRGQGLVFRSRTSATTGNSTSTTRNSRSSNGASERSPQSLAETGYDLCPSSDLSDLTRTTTLQETVTPSPTRSLASLTLSDVKSEKYATASQESTEFGTAAVASSRLSSPFHSLPSISSDYGTAHSVSSYRTAGIYTVDEVEDDLPEIPSESQLNTPTLSLVSIRAAPELEMTPSEIPTISSPSVHSELLPEEIPLPRSVSSPLSPRSSHSPRSSVQLRWRPLPVPPTSSPSYSLSPAPTQLTPSIEERHMGTPTSLKSLSSVTVSSLPAEETTGLSPTPSLPPSASDAASVLTPTSLRGLSTPTRSTPTHASIPATRLRSTTSSSFSITSSGSASAVTPASLRGLSTPTTRSTPTVASIPATRRRSTTSSTFSFTSSVSPLSLTQTSTSFAPLIPQAWASATDLSYDSSILQPSPSVRSVAIEEEIEASFETSFLRPSASPSSWGSRALPPSATYSRPQSLASALKTIPVSPSSRHSSALPPSATHSRPQSVASALTPIPVLSPSISSFTDVRTPTSVQVPPVTVSPGRALPRLPSVSLSTETLLTASLLEAGPDVAVFEETTEQVFAPSTQPSTISIVEPPPRRSPTPAPTPAPTPSPSPGPGPGPSPVASRSLPTPEVSIIVSLTTPHGSGATEQSSLRTRPSVNLVAERDFSDDFARLADELHTLNQVRGLEHQQLVTDIGELREQVQGITDFVHSTTTPAPPPPRSPSPITPTAEEEPRQRELIDRKVGGSSVVSPPSSSQPRVVEVAVPAPISITPPGYSTSYSEDLQSYVSSHHSDDDIFEDIPLLSRPVREKLRTRFTSSGSSSLSSTPYASSSELAPEAPDIDQIPNVVEQALEEIRVQLHALENSQATNISLLGSLQREPEDHVPELVERLQRIEDLFQTYLEQGHPRGPELIHPRPPPTPPAESIAESAGSMRRLRSLLNDLVSRVETEERPPPISVSVPSRTEPLVPQRFDEYFLPTPITPTRSEIPEIEPFVYHPVGRSRARSTSPVSVDRLPPPTQTVQLSYYPIATEPRAMRRRRRRPVTQEPPEPALPPRPATPEAERILSQRRIRRDVARQPLPRQAPPPPPLQQRPRLLLPPPGEALRPRQSITQQPISPTGHRDRAKSVSVTVDMPEQRRPRASWYHPREEEVPYEQKVVTSAPPPRQPRVSYIPMPAGTTVVQFPRLDPSMAVLRENRLAQLATVDQQRELMRYMKGLNDWLERDVHNRHREIRRVNTTVEELTRDLRGVQRRSRRDTVRSSRRRRPAPSPTTGQSTIRSDLPASSAAQMPSFPVVPPGVQSVPVERRRAMPSVPLQRQPTMLYPVDPRHSRQSQPAIVFLPAIHRRHTQPNGTDYRPQRRP